MRNVSTKSSHVIEYIFVAATRIYFPIFYSPPQSKAMENEKFLKNAADSKNYLQKNVLGYIIKYIIQNVYNNIDLISPFVQHLIIKKYYNRCLQFTLCNAS